MNENSTNDKPRIDIRESQVGVVGHNAHIEGGIHFDQHGQQVKQQINVARDLHVHQSVPQSEPLDIETLRTQVKACGALLRQHKHTIANTDEHLPREIVEEIVAWIQDPPEDQQVAMLVDQAGMGKTVVMRDVLYALESLGIVVLAIKADLQFSAVIEYEDLQTHLQLPESIEKIAERFTATTPFVVLLDQIDALSLSLSRDQRALDIATELLARLRLIPGVRILFSCRTFDYHNDPKLNSIEVKKRFSIPGFSSAEVIAILQEINVQYGALSPNTRRLLSTPLHLDLFVRVLESQPGLRENLYDLNSLQALYHHLWLNVITQYGPDIPPESKREEVLWVLTNYMYHNRITTVPHSVFTQPTRRYLQPAVHWLASAGILIRGLTQWSFLHQTFFDYCYARHFVQGEQCLSKTILESDQGLFARSQFHQVIAYLREVQPATYLYELNALLTAQDLRFHLHDLLLRWFGTIPNPSDGEWSIAYRMLLDPVQRPRLLQVISGNRGWFVRIDGQPLQILLTQDEQTLDQQIIPYLISLIDVAQPDVIRVTRPYLGRSEQWNQRLSWLLFRIHTWNTAEAVELLEQLIAQIPDFNFEHFYKLPELVQAYPCSGCRIIRLAFDRVLETCERKRAIEMETPRVPLFIGLELNSLGKTSLTSALEIVVQAEPQYFVQTMLPWLENALRSIFGQDKNRLGYGFDDLAFHWYDDVNSVHHVFVRSFITALAIIAETEPSEFRKLASCLASLPGQTPQMFVSHVYRRFPHLYGEDAWRFLLADQHRLDLGDTEQYESRQLIRAIFPYLSVEQRTELETAIMATFTGIWRPRTIEDLRYRGWEQLHLFQAIPVELLSEQGWHALGELERKFPGERASDTPRVTEGGAINSPIPLEIARRMSDRAWLHALRKYQDGVEHKDFLKGGAEELAQTLAELIKETPERFYLLLSQVPDTVDAHYVRAYLNGLAESDAPIEWIFDVVRRFASQPRRNFRCDIAWALRKRTQESFPDDIVALLEGYVHESRSADEIQREQIGRDLESGYLNSDRGSALGTLMRVLDQRENIEHKWELIEYVAQDSSAVLRAGAVHELVYMLRNDRERAINLFENLLDGYSALLECQWVHKFLHYSIRTHFSRLKTFVRALLDSDDEICQQYGAEFACTVAMSPYIQLTDAERTEAQILTTEATTGTSAHRLAIARVYAANIANVPSLAQDLSKLLNDEDVQVRRMAGSFVDHLQARHIFELREFLEDFAASRAMHRELHAFAKYLWEHGTLDSSWTLSIVTLILNNQYSSEETIWDTGAEKLIRLVLNIYHDPTVLRLREKAMDVFDRLMDRYTSEAQRVLRQWDDR